MFNFSFQTAHSSLQIKIGQARPALRWSTGVVAEAELHNVCQIKRKIIIFQKEDNYENIYYLYTWWMCLLRNYNILNRMSIQYKNNDIFIFSSEIMKYITYYTYSIIDNIENIETIQWQYKSPFINFVESAVQLYTNIKYYRH